MCYRLPPTGYRLISCTLKRSHMRVRAATVLTAALLAACSAEQPAQTRPTSANEGWFTERAAASGLDFVHFNGMSGELYYPEMFAPGVGLIDIENDGDLDVYVVQGQMLGPGKSVGDAVFPPTGTPKDRLFRNDLTVTSEGARTLRFTDITDASGIDIRTFG